MVQFIFGTSTTKRTNFWLLFKKIKRKFLFNFRHEDAIWRIRWADLRHDYLLATAGFDKKVKFWLKEKSNDNVFTEIFSCSQLGASVNAIDFAPYKKELLLVAGAANGKLMLISNSFRYL